MSSNIVPRKDKFFAIKKLVEDKSTLEKIARALPSHITPEKMARVFLTAVTTTPKLLDCEPESLMSAVLEASTLGLIPDGGTLGHGHILPFKSKAKFIPGFRGLMDLARRSGKVGGIQARLIFEGDKFHCEYGSAPKLVHVPAKMLNVDEGKMIGAYASATLIETGEVVFEVMWADDIEAIRKRSPGKGVSGPWVTDTGEMWRKTPLRRLMKYLPLSAEVISAVMSAEYADAGVLGKIIEAEDGDIDAESVTTLETLVGVGDDEGSEPPDFDGKGRISDEEEQGFNKAIEALIERAKASSTAGLTIEMYNKFLGSHGVENINEIRSRAAREDFYNTMREEVEAWESLA